MSVSDVSNPPNQQYLTNSDSTKKQNKNDKNISLTLTNEVQRENTTITPIHFNEVLQPTTQPMSVIISPPANQPPSTPGVSRDGESLTPDVPAFSAGEQHTEPNLDAEALLNSVLHSDSRNLDMNKETRL